MSRPAAVTTRVYASGEPIEIGGLTWTAGEFIPANSFVTFDPATGKVVNCTPRRVKMAEIADKKTRTAKSPEQKAQEALDVSGRKLVRLHDRKDELKRALESVERDIVVQEKEHAYLSANPHLPAVQTPLREGSALAGGVNPA